MSRKHRLHFPGAVYHVILRGNGEQDIFFDASDRTRFFYSCRKAPRDSLTVSTPFA